MTCPSDLTQGPFSLDLFQERHALRLRVAAAAGDAVQVYAAGHSGACNIGAVPHCLVASCRLHLIYQPHYFLTQKVVHCERDVGLLRHLVGDRGGRIERVGGSP